MDPNTFPTKGNLILAKNSLALAKQGFELMDKKRNILIREMMGLIDQDVYKRQMMTWTPYFTDATAMRITFGAFILCPHLRQIKLTL